MSPLAREIGQPFPTLPYLKIHKGKFKIFQQTVQTEEQRQRNIVDVTQAMIW